MDTNEDIIIFWFRQDLRIVDNPGLSKSLKSDKVLPIYILDDINSNDFAMGAASRWWLHNSLRELNKNLDNKLSLYKGDPLEILESLSSRFNIKGIFWNRCYEPWRIERDKKIKSKFIEKDIIVETFNSALLWEPWEILKSDNTPYKVFTPYYRKGCLMSEAPRKPLSAPNLNTLFEDKENILQLDDLNLLPRIKWYKEMEKLWEPGEKGAHKKLESFLSDGLLGYKEGRNFPSKKNVSQLSAHMHFGEISPNQVWHRAKLKKDLPGIEKDLDHFLSELGWREFSYNLLFHFPELPRENLQKKFDNFPWIENEILFDKWKKGLTGYPIVDAGMRELWQTGYMHNRVRMIVGSFLVKNLLLHWHKGEKWFWDCLIDADLASNSASWQWVAGSGADAAPYFRIFNPILQGKRFDPDGSYIKKFIPELEQLPSKYLFSPWEAPIEVLSEANIELGSDYPEPIVDLIKSRDRALEAFSTIRIKA
ncbi:deoxyribodipyrimidine photo-lyase [Desulfobacterota bacterium]|nr:deoxyribodipyrimidine photo-lyase [Thermodesulfobacteriota bacterium]|tara:strand:- start:1789 stop:3228 length:1440 start_codon:yes stop_codon:yes gene_type:complete